jgi:hypothetical protein
MKKYLAFLTFILFVSCERNENIEILQLLPIEPLEIPISESFNPDRTRAQYYESDSGEYLAILNKTNFSIGIFELEKKQLDISISLTKEGPNGVGLDNGFHILAKDSIFLATIPPEIKILNFDGELLQSISLENKDNSVNFLSSNNEIPFLFSHNKLFGIQPFFNDFFNISENDASSINPIYQVDFSTPITELSWLPIKRPSGFWDEGRKDENLSWTDRFDSIVVAPYTDHRLWVISKREKKIISIIEAKAKSVNNFQILSESDLGGDKGIVESLGKDRYEIIQYDKYRDVFYRFFFKSINWEDYNLSPRKLFSNRPIVGILVLDNTLSTIGEYVFDTHHIQPWNYFVGKKGLYVSTNNPNRDDFDENFLRYDIIRFEGLEYED